MKTNWIALIVVMISCTSNTEIHPVIPPRIDEHPLAEFAFTATGDPGSNFNWEASTPDYPEEFGIEFKVERDGVLFALGFNMPMEGKYYVSLWDVSTKSLLVRDSADYTTPSKFLYVDLLLKNHSVDIVKNKKYMASVYVSRLPSGGPRQNYTLFQPGVGSWVPVTQGSVIITGNYYTKEDFPTYPSTQILHNDVLNGLVDIGFYKTEY